MDKYKLLKHGTTSGCGIEYCPLCHWATIFGKCDEFPCGWNWRYSSAGLHRCVSFMVNVTFTCFTNRLHGSIVYWLSLCLIPGGSDPKVARQSQSCHSCPFWPLAGPSVYCWSVIGSYCLIDSRFGQKIIIQTFSWLRQTVLKWYRLWLEVNGSVTVKS